MEKASSHLLYLGHCHAPHCMDGFGGVSFYLLKIIGSLVGAESFSES